MLGTFIEETSDPVIPASTSSDRLYHLERQCHLLEEFRCRPSSYQSRSSYKYLVYGNVSIALTAPPVGPLTNH
ncbi:hypothetical protein BDZ89DRAFT_1075282 [Hymenopellis radicata]|nr:hypothetical protein BDZ89DRAFT_1075282 [Hymenopellis radicata]